MAHAFPAAIFFRRWEAMLNPCRWCGEKAQLERNQSDWTLEDRLRVTCPEVHEPIYLANSIYRGVDSARYFGNLFAACKQLADFWNEIHDGPAFMAGLA